VKALKALIIGLIVIGLFVIPIVNADLSGKDGHGYYPMAVVSGVSMEPILHSGDVVFIEKVNPSQVHVGDVIVYKWIGKKYVIHRVAKIYKFDNRLCFVTWGDDRKTNPFPDPGYPSECGYVKVKDPITKRYVIASGVPSYEILGKVVSFKGYIIKIPYIGSLAIVLRK